MADGQQQPPPEGPVRYAWFGGLLEARRGDDAKLEEAVARGNRLNLARMDLDLDGGKFTLLFDDCSVPGEQLTPERSEELVAVLNDVVGSSSDSNGVESTLRCTEVYEGGAVDTLFTPRSGAIDCVSRSRPVGMEDQRHAPSVAAEDLPVLNMGRRRALGLGALALVAFALLAWQSGLIDRLAATGADAVELDTGPFGKTLAVEVASRWGSYRVTLRRGEAWPADASAAQAGIDGAGTMEEGAAMRAVADGRGIWVQLRSKDGQVLAAATVELAPLMREGTDQLIEVTLPGSFSASSLVLALDEGKD